ncbi:RNA-binding domain-containing protein [Exidia glandulosa HHB12029]|uniref:Multiple RNA-binding domain-containing protein 1 n=1 Tax=Exidia glandulosa HHB12029 TaxID=1314781 RepID=A0A165FRL2_EXIGL|nr:RNA-binding domain-containing protein [Exidia glandulosa HHB12029]
MSRLIVKGLPSYLTESRLREHFATKGIVTDTKILYNQDGTSRRFGFVGFKSDKDAQVAKEYFDATYIGTSKIFVQVVQGTKDAPAPRPHKRPRLTGPDDTPERPTVETKKTEPSKPDKKKSAKLDEFVKVMQPKKGRAWSNGEEPVEPTPVDVDMAEDAQSEPEEIPEGVSDLEWMRRRMKTTVLDDSNEKAFEQSDDEDNAQPTHKNKDVQDATNEPTEISPRLFVRNLAFSCTEADLTAHFAPYGTLAQVHIPLDPATKTSKGLAFVTFSTPEEAVAAREALDGTSFQGRLLHILPAIERRKAPALSAEQLSVKARKEQNRKLNAGKEFNWAMLYMNADAVASSIADRMKIDKSVILNPDDGEGGNAAVKLALAETHVINETKTYFEDEGVSLESFTSRQRSDTIILVKNIPYGTSTQELRELFEPHGTVVRLLLPPAGTIAVVEFAHASDAGKAFKAVAYKRLKNSVVYLEYGPLGMFTAPPASSSKAVPTKKPEGGVVRVQDKDAIVAADSQGEIASGSTLFVKNLAFSTTPDRLRAVFSHLPGFVFVRVQEKPDPKRPGATLSMGYGFVGFKTPEDAKSALAGMQGFVLDGHELAVKFAARGTEDEKDDGKGAGMGARKSAKMIVKNVPFEASKKDLRELFGAHGHLKSVRLPKKFNSRSRGFAFLEFVSRQEAEHAFATLRHTHLLGRHLVLEWASEESVDVEELRDKTRAGFGDGKELANRKRKLVLDDDDAPAEEED